MATKSYTSSKSLTTDIGQWLWTSRWGPGAVVGSALMVIYLFTLQGADLVSERSELLNASEALAALSLSAAEPIADYPLYVLLGAPLAGLLRLVGINAVTAAATVSLLWGFAALIVMYDLLRRRTDSPCQAALIVLVIGVMQSVWLHSVVVEVYSLYLLLGAVILWLALGKERETVWTRLRWMALLFALGVGVAHHWALVLLIPGLLVVMLPRFRSLPRPLPVTLTLSVALLVAGFLPYLLLPLYARIGNFSELVLVADINILHVFLGREARAMWDANLTGVGFNLASTLGILANQITWGALLATVLLGPVSMLNSRTYSRSEGALLLVSIAIYVLFISIFRDIISPEAFLLPALLMLALLGGEVLNFLLERTPIPVWGMGIALAMMVATLIRQTAPLIRAITL